MLHLIAIERKSQSLMLYFSLKMFYMYLYIASLCFLFYVYYYLLRRHRIPASIPKISSMKENGFSGLLRSLSTGSKDSTTGKPLRRRRRVSLDPNNHHTGSFYLRLGAIGEIIYSFPSGANFARNRKNSTTLNAIFVYLRLRLRLLLETNKINYNRTKMWNTKV